MVYSPKEDSYLLQKQVLRFAKNKSFLDMGSGSGIQAQSAVRAEAKSVLATDISPAVINHLRKNNIQCIKSDLFNNVKSKFDLIAFNPPYLPEDKREDKESQKATTGGKKGDEIILKFLEQAKEHLKPNGKILLVISSLTPRNEVESLIAKLKLKKRTLSEKKLFMEKLEVWEIIKEHDNNP